MPFCQLFYHLVWATHGRADLVTPDIEQEVYGRLWQKAIGLEAMVFAINGMPDHVHMVAMLPPTLAVADLVGQVKGFASYQVNRTGLTAEHFAWQAEYGAFTFDRKRLPNYVSYVENQKSHHDQKTVIAMLERTEEYSAIGEPPSSYAVDDLSWRRELESFGDNLKSSKHIVVFRRLSLVAWGFSPGGGRRYPGPVAAGHPTRRPAISRTGGGRPSHPAAGGNLTPGGRRCLRRRGKRDRGQCRSLLPGRPALVMMSDLRAGETGAGADVGFAAGKRRIGADVGLCRRA